MDVSRYRDLFVEEAREHIHVLNEALMELEREKTAESIERFFRSAHTLKGMSATMGFASLSELAHQAEDLMDDVRQGRMELDDQAISLLFGAVDAISQAVEAIARGEEVSGGVVKATELLRAFRTGEALLEESEEAEAEQVAMSPANLPKVTLRVSLDNSCRLPGVRAFMVLERLREVGHVVGTSPDEQELMRGSFGSQFRVDVATDQDEEALRERVLGIGEVREVEVIRPEVPKPIVAEVPPPVMTPPVAPGSVQHVRVNVRHLDDLINVVGEMVTAWGQLRQVVAEQRWDELGRVLGQQERMLADLRVRALQLRMIPVGQVFQRFPRMVRDLLHAQGKEADLIIEGEDIEIDRAIVERLADPLVHMLRNAVDHGIEPPEARERQGKPRRGRLVLRARRERGQAVIEVCDDGRGLDREAIIRRAVSMGLVTPEYAEDLDDQRVFMFICTPGFTTSSAVTRVSGRGVGMEVVKAEVDALRGALEIESRPGQGTCFRMRLPLTLSIVSALLVQVGEERYAVPTFYVERTVDLDPQAIRKVHHWRFFSLAEEVVPLFYLGQVLHVSGYVIPRREVPVLVVRRGQQHIGLAVDELIDKSDVVVKELPESLRQLPGIGGATLMGDGRVVLILDVMSLVEGLR